MICDEETENGTCTVVINCEVDEDCPAGGFCDDMGDDDATTNICDCNVTTCDAFEAEQDDGFDYECRDGNDEDFASICTVPSTCGDAEAGVYGDDTICPEGYSCIPRNRIDRDDDVTAGNACYPNNIQCRSETGLFLDNCPQFMGCVDES